MNYEHEIQRAEKHLGEMADTNLVSDYEAAWQDFLYRLERIWERIVQQYQKEPWFHGLHGPYAILRKKDPLVRYLKQARNAETHTFSGTISSPLSVRMRDKFGYPFSIRELSTDFKNGVLTLSINTDELFFEPDIEVSRNEPHLVRFKSRGKWYNPPNAHLGNVLESKDPVIIGKLGLEFSNSFISELSAKEKKT